MIEPLENRIAPATILVGDLGSNDTEYKEPPGLPGTDVNPAFVTPFFDTDAGAADSISAVVGPGNPGVPDTFYLKLGAGDSLLIHTSIGYVPFITGLGGLDAQGHPIGIAGNVVAFFVDKNSNNEVDANELTGLSLGKNVSVQVSGSVDGDIVSNFNDNTFALGGAGEAVGVAQDLLLNPITSLVVTGNISGSVVSGGTINEMKIGTPLSGGAVKQVLTGKAADGYKYDFLANTGAVPDGGDTLSVSPLPGEKGPGIMNVSITTVDTIKAGNGGAAAEGGSITNVTLGRDVDGFTVQAGAGGDGVVGKINGGLGGHVSKLIINGLKENEADPSPNQNIEIHGGDGGDGLAATASKGGIGGAVSDVYVSFKLQEGKLEVSKNALNDKVLVQSGAGGDGKTGSAGGNLTNINVVASPTGAGNDISLLSGTGGANSVAVKGGKAGVGGAIVGVDVKNPNNSAAAHTSQIVIHAGSAGTAMAGFGSGAAGGSVTDAHTIGYMVDLRAGNGSAGLSGGAGGNLSKLVIDEGFIGVRAESAILDAGNGAIGTATKGGNGGTIAGVVVNNADFKVFLLNQTAGAADGGNSAKGTGGTGGLVRDVDIVDLDSIANPNPNNEATMMLRAGAGGSGGGASGGAGGSFTGDNTIFATDAKLILTSGGGGNAVGKGNGGKAGDVLGFGFFGFGSVGGAPATAFLSAAKGGDGAGTGAGGAGGKLNDISLNADGSVSALAGPGGAAGAAGAAGVGGAITLFSELSRTGSVTATAGDAGMGGIKAAAGGAITNASLLAATTVAVKAGDGRNGGVGGSVTALSFSDPTGTTGTASAVGITAGLGSGLGKAAGKGGDIANVSGYIDQTGLTIFKAGNARPAAGAVGDTKSANGGSITDITLFGGGGAGAELQIEAGDAVAVPNAKKGGDGGSVNGVSIGDPFNPADIDPATVIRRIVGGAGGDVTIAKGVGGTGGSVLEVRASHDIGVRSGSAFGYDTMGGIFAGLAGLSGVGGKVAPAGSVIGITADSIAAIVAGKPLNGDVIGRKNLVEVVDAIVLTDHVASVVDANGAYTNFGVANIVGGVVNPTAASVPYPAPGAPDPGPHANTFDPGEYVDSGAANVGVFGFGDATNAMTDGFVAAVKFFNDTTTPNSVRVEALLTVDAAGASVFLDLNNYNGQIVN